MGYFKSYFLLLGGSAISYFILKRKDKVRVTMLSKINTALQMSLLGYILWEEGKKKKEEEEEKNEKKSLLIGTVACSTTLSALEYLLIFLKKMR